MTLQTDGKKLMLEAFGTAAVKCALYGSTGTEITGGSYAKQTISWSYNGTNVILNANLASGKDYVAEFSVPACTVKYVGFLNTGGTVVYAKVDLGSKAETFANPGKYQVTAASLELDPA